MIIGSPSPSILLAKIATTPGFTVGILAGAVDIAVTEADIIETAVEVVKIEVLLDRELGYPVGRDRADRVFLIGGEVILLAVNRSPGRGEDKLGDTGLFASLEDIETADDIDPGVELGSFHRLADIDLGGMVIDNVEFFGPEKVFHLGSADIHLHETGGRGDILPPAGGKIIKDYYLMARGQIGVGHMRADKTGTAGYQYFHNAYSL